MVRFLVLIGIMLLFFIGITYKNIPVIDNVVYSMDINEQYYINIEKTKICLRMYISPAKVKYRYPEEVTIKCITHLLSYYPVEEVAVLYDKAINLVVNENLKTFYRLFKNE